MSHPHPEDRQAAIAWARSVVNDPNVCFLDTETTGLDDAAEVLELAIIDQEANTLFNHRFRPARLIPSAASAVHGLTDRDVAQCPHFSDMWPVIRGLLRGRRVISYNAAFDTRLVWQSLAHYRTLSNMAIPSTPWECAMEAYAAWYGAWSPWHGSYTYKPLSFAAAATGDVPDHSALGDARACRAVVRRLALEEAG